MREAKAIKESIRNTKKATKFLSMVATEENFDKMLRNEPQVLHISCHGIHNSPETMGEKGHELIKKEGSFLLLEDKDGSGRLLSTAKI